MHGGVHALGLHRLHGLVPTQKGTRLRGWSQSSRYVYWLSRLPPQRKGSCVGLLHIAEVVLYGLNAVTRMRGYVASDQGFRRLAHCGLHLHACSCICAALRDRCGRGRL